LFAFDAPFARPRYRESYAVENEDSVSPQGRRNQSPRELDRAMVTLAGGQYGVVSRRQLLAVGFGRRAIDRRIERGILNRVHRGVYSVGRPAMTRRTRWRAAVLACGPNAVLSHRSAAVLWQLLSPSTRAIELTRATGWSGPSEVFLHRQIVPPDERTVVDGIPVTSPPRTIFDLAASASRRAARSRVSRREVERALNQMEVLGLRDALAVPDLLARYPRRAGSALLRDLFGEPERLSGVAANDLEEWFVALVERWGLPRPRINADLAVGDRFIRPDFMWPDRRLIVEADGRGAHGTGQAFESDRERDRLLVAAGWRVMRVTWRQLRDTPQEVVRDLRRALGEER
jgi:very-short-patch-repair endonuclease